MAKYYILTSDSPWAGPVLKKTSGPNVKLTFGHLKDIDDTFEFNLEVDSQAKEPNSFPPLDYHRTARQPIFSERFQEVLLSLSIDNIQYFPAEVIYKPTKENFKYKVANVVGSVEALDRVNSDCQISDNGVVYGFTTMVLDESKLEGIEFARMFEKLNIIIISERVANALKEAKLTGLSIMKPEEWQPGII